MQINQRHLLSNHSNHSSTTLHHANSYHQSPSASDLYFAHGLSTGNASNSTNSGNTNTGANSGYNDALLRHPYDATWPFNTTNPYKSGASADHHHQV